MSEKQTHAFQAEVKQILHLVTHSLYSNKEIFLRELISNASRRLRQAALRGAGQRRRCSRTTAEPRRSASSSTRRPRPSRSRDNGIGMCRSEAIEHLGTIAKSGTREFLAKLEGDQKKRRQPDRPVRRRLLLGLHGRRPHHGRVAPRRPAGRRGRALGATGRATSRSRRSTRPQRGTDVILHLREDEEEFLKTWKLKSIIAQVLRPHLAADPDAQGEVGRRGSKSRSRTTSGRPSTRRRRCGRAPRARSPTRSTRSSTSRSATTPTRRWPTRTTASRAAANTRSCCTSRPRRRSTCGTATSAAASSCTSSASSSWTTPRR